MCVEWSHVGQSGCCYRIKLQASEHNRTLELTLGSVKQEYEAKIKEAVQSAQAEERKIRQQETDELRASMEAEKKAMESDYSAIVETKTSELQDLSLVSTWGLVIAYQVIYNRN